MKQLTNRSVEYAPLWGLLNCSNLSAEFSIKHANVILPKANGGSTIYLRFPQGYQQRRVMDQSSSQRKEQTRYYKRGTKGRFVTASPFNSKKIRRSIKQIEHVERRKDDKRIVFEKFTIAFVRQGKKNQSLPSSRSKGPLTTIFKSTVKEEFRLGANIRHAYLRRFYFDGGHLTSPSRAVPEPRAKQKEYRGCRLPLVKYASEMAAVRRWIEFMSEKNALMQKNVEEAYEFCKRIIRSYVTGCSADVSDESNDVRPPSTLTSHSNQNSVCLHCKSASMERESIQDVFRSLDKTTLSEQTAPVVYPAVSQRVEGEEQETVPISSFENASATGENVFDCPEEIAEENGERKPRLRVLFATARSDTLYLMVHSVLDSGMEHKFGLFAKKCLDELKESGLEAPRLFLEALKYVHWNRFAIPNEEEHAQRIRELQATAYSLDRILTCISTKEKTYMLYEDMKKYDFRQNKA